MLFHALRSAARGLLARARSLWRGVTRRDEVESEMREEFAHHIEMRAADLERTGLSGAEARRQARLEFGKTDTYREHARASRGLRSVDQLRFSWLDLRLALRMLVKHPMLTLVSVFALAVGIPVGLAPSHLAKALERPIPGDPDGRIRAIRFWDPLTSSVAPTRYADFDFWSDELPAFAAVAAFRSSTYAVGAAGAPAAAAAGAQLSSAAFQVLPVPPLLGRVLSDADAAPGAPDVVLLGHDLWTARFGADPAIVGRTIQVGRVPHTVVGVMPKGFRFPSNEQLWLPLRIQPASAEAQLAPVRIFGRLADRITSERAQAELSATGLASLAEPDETRLRLQPEVVPFGLLYAGVPRGGLASMPEFRFVRLLTLGLLLVACGNVALLLFARTASRLRELAVRTALGASRARIVSQIFVEALVLAILAAGIGVGSIDWALRHVNLAALAGETALPYWLSLGATGDALLRAVGLAALSATVAGVLPALRITGKGIQQGIRYGAGRSGLKFGGLTGALIVADIAVAVASVSLAIGIADKAVDPGEAVRLAGIRADEYLSVELTMLDDGVSTGGPAAERFAARLASAERTLVAELEREPGVVSVTLADALPRMDHRSSPIEIEGVEVSTVGGPRWVRTARVDPGFFTALGQQPLAGRLFDQADADSGRATVIVNSSFVERMLGGGEAIGRRIRLGPRAGEGDWREIVGVVRHLGVNMINEESGGAVYLPTAPGRINPVLVSIHASADPASLIPRVREVASRIDADLRMGPARVLSDVYQGDWYLTLAIASGLGLLVGVLLAMAIIGIYAMLSFSVAERTREIGIRAALGASRRALVAVLLRRSLIQIAIGAAIGLPVAWFIVLEVTGNGESDGSPITAALGALGLGMIVVSLVGVAACLQSSPSDVAIQAGEALRRGLAAVRSRRRPHLEAPKTPMRERRTSPAMGPFFPVEADPRYPRARGGRSSARRSLPVSGHVDQIGAAGQRPAASHHDPSSPGSARAVGRASIPKPASSTITGFEGIDTSARPPIQWCRPAAPRNGRPGPARCSPCPLPTRSAPAWRPACV
ncbi:MAG: ABC transporter permease [Gemmatimonadales bacterium]